MIGFRMSCIDDSDNTLTDDTTRKGCLIKRQWNIQLYLGKTQSNLNRWFYGKIMETDVITTNTNVQKIRLVCVGWGIRLKDRVTNIKRFQDKESDGETLNVTDVTTRASELVKDILNDTDHLPHQGLSTESDITEIGVDTVDVKLADFQQNFQSFSSSISQLAAASGAVYGIDADRDVIFRIPDSNDSGFLFTNDLDGLDAQGWDSTKIGYLLRSPIGYTDSTFESGISVLHGLGCSVVNKDIENTSANSTRSLHLSWLAIPFMPTQNNITKLSLSLSKTGIPVSGSADFRIVGDDGVGFPNINDLRKQFVLGEEALVNLGVSGDWIELSFGEVAINPLDQLYLIVKVYGNGTDTFVADYQTGTGTYFTSSDGSSWGSSTGGFKFRSYSSNPINIIVENTTSRKAFGTREKIINFRTKTQEETGREALINISDVIGKERRIYSGIVVSPVTDRIPLGSKCRIQNSQNNMNFTAEIIAVDLTMIASDSSNLGANKIELTLQEQHY